MVINRSWNSCFNSYFIGSDYSGGKKLIFGFYWIKYIYI